MLKKLYVTYLVPFKTISAKEVEELQRFFDSISESDFQFIDVNKLLQDSVESIESHATHMDKLLPIDYATIGDDVIVVIDFRRFFADSTGTTTEEIQKFDIDKLIKETIKPEDILKIDLVKSPIYDYVGASDQYSDVISFVRTFNELARIEDSVPSKNISKTLYSELDGSYDTLSLSTTDFEYAEVYINEYLGIVAQFIRKFDDAISFQHRLFKSSTKILRDGHSVDDSYVARSVQKPLGDETNGSTDRPYITPGLFKQDALSEPTDILTRIVNYIRKPIDTVTTDEKIQKFDSTKLLRDSFNPDDNKLLSYTAGIKQDAFLYQPNEDGFIQKYTYIDAQYYSNDYVDTTDLAFKVIYELTTASDSTFILPNYCKFEYITSSDLGGSLLNNTYTDSGYFSGNYIGTSASF